jgi:hypothetical protein
MLLEKERCDLRSRRSDQRCDGSCFAREGAVVFLAGRIREPLEAVAAGIAVARGNKYRESVNGEDS